MGSRTSAQADKPQRGRLSAACEGVTEVHQRQGCVLTSSNRDTMYSTVPSPPSVMQKSMSLLLVLGSNWENSCAPGGGGRGATAFRVGISIIS